MLESTGKFQSLSGFQVRCNQNGGGLSMAAGHSFNPYRVFKFVATTTTCRWTRPIKRFQSLSGFQVRCNSYRDLDGLSRGAVSIPIGFSSSLQPRICYCRCADIKIVSIPIGFSSSLQHREFGVTLDLSCRVSIPIGFSSSLQLQVLRPVWSGPGSFNPYRVFKFVATAPFEWLFLAIILSKSQKLRPPGMNLFRTRPL